ncbi:hypothetical protein J2125_001297 [Erwinia toletana]|uniref:DUF2509 family protein n=1 Tax=Winslowiella toletana TaxID=92490 RepID=A0ABS4P691_9GAMM|nr:DUF2509 family protein [Winslowiella toletana]MBP2168105.1 hypothetical protein [Winslowiella toletana]
MSQQQGSGVLSMVVMILLLGTALLHATRQQLAASLSLVAHERRHIIDFYAAQGALAWGSQLLWSENSGWQCQTEPQQQWRACLNDANAQRGLLRGEHLNDAGPALTLWRWVQPDAAVQGRVLPLAHGWIDFCPLNDAAECDPDVH